MGRLEAPKSQPIQRLNRSRLWGVSAKRKEVTESTYCTSSLIFAVIAAEAREEGAGRTKKYLTGMGSGVAKRVLNQTTGAQDAGVTGLSTRHHSSLLLIPGSPENSQGLVCFHSVS